MTTAQKTISMRYIAFGLFTSLFIIGASCKKNTSWVMNGDFYFINETAHAITYAQSGFDEFNIPPNSSILISETQDGREDIEPGYYHSPLIRQGIKNSLVVKFDNAKCLETFNRKNTPLNIENYASENLGRRTYKFTYTFTQADYDAAINCP